jgi:O-antigen ligase
MMRSGRLGWSLLAVYLVFLGGSSYYFLLFPVRVFHHVIITLLLAVWLIVRIRRGQGLPKTLLNVPLMVLVIVWFISAFLGLDARVSLENLWFPLTHLLMFYVMVDLLQRGRHRFLMEIQFLIATLVVMLALWQLISWYFGLGITPDTRLGWASVIGPEAWLPLEPLRLWLGMNVSTWLAAFTASLVVVVAGWAMTTQRRDYRLALWILAGLLALVMILTFSRSGILALTASIVFFVVMQLIRRYGFYHLVSLQTAPTFVVMIIIIGIVFISVTLIGRTRRDVGDNSRLELWRVALATMSEQPLTGVGTGEYGRALRMYRGAEYGFDRLSTAHNVYLNTAAENGLIAIAVNIWIGILFLSVVWRNWKSAVSPGAKIRLEAVFAGLIAFATASLVDTFTTTSMLLLFFLLAAYCLVGQRNRFDPPPASEPRWTSVIALIGVVVYGLWFVQLDRAHARYIESIRPANLDSLKQAQAAHELDPGMRLYQLQALYIEASLPTTDLDMAVELYQQAMLLEPTWETGALNLAALLERKGEIEESLGWLDRARQINARGSAALHWARLAEKLDNMPAEDVISAYLEYMRFDLLALPLSDFWWQTELRREAVQQFMNESPLDIRYRIAAVHLPQMLPELVPTQPVNAADFWVLGEFALNQQNDAEEALLNFNQAVALDRNNGDYYVSRARSLIDVDAEAAERNLKIAELLGTVYEYPNVVRVQMTANPQMIYELRVQALQPRVQEQNFEAVLFNRVAAFDVLPEMRRLGPGRQAMQPWYAIAADYLANGNEDAAVGVYRAILDYASDESEAREQIVLLQGANE